ncbi:MAG TPA: IclR family transcriptional regulator [Thermomicrobiaceae bacterium]|nr:IclR family transcriptional regulator [Thermomicrobiaceae bacterium]
MEVVAEKYRVESVARAVVLLGAFLRPPHRFGVTELSKATKLTKNQTFRLLQTLVQERLVVQDPDTRAYALGYRLVELGAVASTGSTLVQIANPVLDRLAAETGEAVNLVVRDDELSAISVDKRESRWRLQISARVGTRFDLHAGGTTKVLLAFSPPEAIERYIMERSPLKRFTPTTITDPDELRAELATIREQGYAVSDQDLDPGVCTVAAPIYSLTDEVFAAVSVAAPVTRFGPKERCRYAKATVAAAREISLRYGAFGPAPSGSRAR